MTSSPVRRRQLACAVALLPVLGWAAWGTPAFVAALTRPCPVGICDTFERPSPQLVAALGELGVGPLGYAVGVTVLAWALLLLSSGIALLLQRSPTGGLLVTVTSALLPVAVASSFFSALASTAGRIVDAAAGVVIAVCLALFVGLFPDGRWHPGWFRWVWPVPAAVSALSLSGSTVFGGGIGESDSVAVAELLSWLGLVGVQVHRYRRRSDWAARAQAKVLLIVLVLTVTLGVLGVVASAAGALAAFGPVAVIGDYTTSAVLGTGLLVALFRYRLYGVDVALRRTAVYAVALVVLAAAYVLLVAVAGSLVSAAAAPAVGGAAVGVLALAVGVAAAVLRERLRRRLFGGHGLARAIAAVAREPTPGPGGDLAATIAQGLALPHVAVLDRDGGPIWMYGDPGPEPHGESVVDSSGERVGTLVLDPPRGSRRLDRQHRRVLAEVLPFVVLVLRARDEAQQLRAARAAAAEAREDERRRLRRDLHDGVGPLLATQLLTVDTLRVAGDRPELLAHLETQARSAIGEVRRLAHDLRPAALDAGGLPAALVVEADRVRLAGLPVDLHVDLDGADVPAAAEVALLRIAQEALANVVKHAGASTASVRLDGDGSAIELRVDDDGSGRRGAPDGMGTASMRDRAAEIGGEVRIGTGPDGRGTRVHARIPR